MADLDLLVDSFGITLLADALAESRSGSQVRRARRKDGADVILKITVAVDGEDRAAAERELAFYRDLRHRVAIRTPELIDQHRSADCVAILITAHEAVRPPTEWTHDHWLTLARDLAALHETAAPAGRLWRHGPDGFVPGCDQALARSYWTRPGEAELFAPIIDDPDALLSAIRSQASCFSHGDCHTHNILVDGDELIWADWQGAGVGRPAGDLAFAVGRATPSGANPPLPEMITEYAKLRSLDRAELERAVLASALSTALLAWPAYAGYNSPAGIDRVHRRTRLLARQWLSG